MLEFCRKPNQSDLFSSLPCQCQQIAPSYLCGIEAAPQCWSTGGGAGEAGGGGKEQAALDWHPPPYLCGRHLAAALQG